MSVMDRRSPPDDVEPQPWRPGAAFWFLLPAATVLIAVYAGPLAYAVNASFTAWSLTAMDRDRRRGAHHLDPGGSVRGRDAALPGARTDHGLGQGIEVPNPASMPAQCGSHDASPD
jgi:ABC-type sugar transport system permease subunit